MASKDGGASWRALLSERTEFLRKQGFGKLETMLAEESRNPERVFLAQETGQPVNDPAKLIAPVSARMMAPDKSSLQKLFKGAPGASCREATRG
jgi:hypothetical protein